MTPEIIIVEIEKKNGVLTGRIVEKIESGQVYKVWEVRDEKGKLMIVFVRYKNNDE